MANAFPKMSNKHRFKVHHTAADRFRIMPTRNIPERLPNKIILVYSRKFNNYLTRTLRLDRQFEVHRLKIKTNKKLSVGVVALDIGAPITAIAVEELSVLGSKDFLILGVAGSLRKNLGVSDMVLCNKAIRDEGVSHHYAKNAFYAYPDRSLTKNLMHKMNSAGLKFAVGPTWTNDAIYAQTKKEIRHYSKIGTMTADMEAAALFTIAKTKREKAAAVFAISDVLYKNWEGIRFPKESYPKLAIVAKIFDKL